MTSDEAYSSLIALWDGELDAAAAKFAAQTGEDLEQCLLLFLTSAKYRLDRAGIDLLLARFRDDSQLYELAHLLIASAFDGPPPSLSADQYHILDSLCQHETIWRCDQHFTEELLPGLSLPSRRDDMRRYLGELDA